MKALIINYNRLSLPSTLANWCYENGLEPIFIDNNSDYQPLLEYYAHLCSYKIVRLKKNFGHTVVWHPEFRETLDKLVGNERYIVTDPDLDCRLIPSDFLDVLNVGLDIYKKYDKCGFSLEINDLPDSKEGAFIRLHEVRYWTKPLGKKYFDSPIDTTFALYREGVREYNHNGIRTNRPYTAKHISWYYTSVNDMAEDERNYFNTANESASGKKRML